mgnify:FL=1|jgi:hypothetical protein|nr:MAG TPA: hypothetical protein [Caudoviricetes sp.]
MISPIKIKICDRDYHMNTSYGEREARVETVDGVVVIKKKEDILPTDRIISYISNDFIQPIKIKIVDLNIVYAFLLGAVARVAFYCGVQKTYLFILSYGKFVSKLAFFSETDRAFFKYYMQSEIPLYSKIESYDSFSKYTVSMKSPKIKVRFLSKMTTRVSEGYLPLEKVGIGIQKIANVIITKITYKKIKDITQNTLEEDFFGDKTIDNLIEIRQDTRSVKE